MAIVATASKTVRFKNLILLLLFAVFAAWFAYDGWKGWPSSNDAIVQRMISDKTHTNVEDMPTLLAWKGWNHTDESERNKMRKVVERNHFDGWHTNLDILFQKIIVVGLTLATVAAAVWFFRSERRRATADEQGLSPAPGTLIPWDAITTIDNSRWKRSGIVVIRYRDSGGQEQESKLDDYLLDNLPPLLNEVRDRAKAATVIPPAEEATA